MKTCYYLTKTNEIELLQEIQEIKHEYDVIAWSAEHFDKNSNDEIVQTVSKIRKELESQTFLFGYREIKGIQSYNKDVEEFTSLILKVIDQRLCDIVEVGMFRGEQAVSSIVQEAKKNNIKVMLSLYMIDELPDTQQIQIRYQAMQRLGADIAYQSFQISNQIECLSIWTALANFNLWMSKIPSVCNVYGYEDAFTALGSIKFGSTYYVVDRNLSCEINSKYVIDKVKAFTLS